MIKIKGDRAVWTLTLDELWWLYHHLPQRLPHDALVREIYGAIVQLEEDRLQKKLGPALWIEIVDTDKEEACI